MFTSWLLATASVRLKLTSILSPVWLSLYCTRGMEAWPRTRRESGSTDSSERPKLAEYKPTTEEFCLNVGQALNNCLGQTF